MLDQFGNPDNPQARHGLLVIPARRVFHTIYPTHALRPLKLAPARFGKSRSVSNERADGSCWKQVVILVVRPF